MLVRNLVPLRSSSIPTIFSVSRCFDTPGGLRFPLAFLASDRTVLYISYCSITLFPSFLMNGHIYSPLNTGALFSLNAFNASTLSLLCNKLS